MWLAKMSQQNAKKCRKKLQERPRFWPSRVKASTSASWIEASALLIWELLVSSLDLGLVSLGLGLGLVNSGLINITV